MPLTKTGKKVLRDFIERYGKKKGTEYFYATMVKHPEKTKSWHGKGTGKLKKAQASYRRKTHKKRK